MATKYIDGLKAVLEGKDIDDDLRTALEAYATTIDKDNDDNTKALHDAQEMNLSLARLVSTETRTFDDSIAGICGIGGKDNAGN